MHPSLKPYFDRVELGYLRTSRKDGLILFGYTEKCTFDRAWDEYTRKARGLIFEEATGYLIATPFPKFFNLGEMEETFFDNLPKNVRYQIDEKMDGSLGIVYFYGGWKVATRGSLDSDQARAGAEILKQYDLSKIPINVTLLVEIIYPENRIIADYGQERKLVLLGANWSDVEYQPVDVDVFAAMTGMPRPTSYNFTVEEAIAKAKVLPKLEEGFVVRYSTGFRVKIKGDEYCKIAKIMAHLSPLSLWEVMVNGKVQTTYLEQIPEEFRSTWEPIRDALEQKYASLLAAAKSSIPLLAERVDIKDMRAVGIFLKENKGWIIHPDLVWPLLRNRPDNLDKQIMSMIKPVGNVLK